MKLVQNSQFSIFSFVFCRLLVNLPSGKLVIAILAITLHCPALVVYTLLCYLLFHWLFETWLSMENVNKRVAVILRVFSLATSGNYSNVGLWLILVWTNRRPSLGMSKGLPGAAILMFKMYWCYVVVIYIRNWGLFHIIIHALSH